MNIDVPKQVVVIIEQKRPQTNPCKIETASSNYTNYIACKVANLELPGLDGHLVQGTTSSNPTLSGVNSNLLNTSGGFLLTTSGAPLQLESTQTTYNYLIPAVGAIPGGGLSIEHEARNKYNQEEIRSE